MEELARFSFRPAWWGPNRHVQTCFGPVVRRRFQRLPDYRREVWDTPDDDFLELYFHHGDGDKPWVILLHGLEGGVDSFYLTGLTKTMAGLGWNTVVMLFRTCGASMNRARRTYHMGEWTDLAFVVGQLNARFDAPMLFLAGVSLGGNVIAKWLGEMGDAVPENLRAAAVISPPFDPSISAPGFHRVLGGLYAKRFFGTLVPKALAKAQQYPGLLDEAAIRRCRDFTCFDTVVTARLHGFEDGEDYWRKVGCGQYLSGVRRPLLLVASGDDPFNEHVPLPEETASASPWLHPLFTRRGGHVGFVQRDGRSWAEAQVRRFFQAYAGP